MKPNSVFLITTTNAEWNTIIYLASSMTKSLNILLKRCSFSFFSTAFICKEHFQEFIVLLS